MPTGLTAAIYEGKRKVSFEEYALGVARQFGACITMRDDPINAEIPERFEPSTYHQDAIDKARKRLVEIGSWDDGRWQDEADKSYEGELKRYHDSLANKKAIKRRYEAMLAIARQYKAPTPGHEDFAKMLVEQLEQSIDWDCSTSYMTEPIRKTASEFKADIVSELNRDIEYHGKQHRDEVERCEGRTQWVQQLRESLQQLA